MRLVPFDDGEFTVSLSWLCLNIWFTHRAMSQRSWGCILILGSLWLATVSGEKLSLFRGAYVEWEGSLLSEGENDPSEGVKVATMQPGSPASPSTNDSNTSPGHAVRPCSGDKRCSESSAYANVVSDTISYNVAISACTNGEERHLALGESSTRAQASVEPVSISYNA